MRNRLPPLNALKAFEAAARHSSFKRAAEDLFVSHSAISHQVRQLEQYLGVELFLRVSRGVKLTREGATYYPLIRDAFDRIDEGTRLILEPDVTAILTVQVYSTFAIRWLIPRLSRFKALHPTVQIRLHTSQSDVRFEHEDVDLCVMIGRRQQTDVTYDYLFSSDVFPVCHPSLLNAEKPMEKFSDLAKHTIIQVYPSANDWRVWLEHHQVQGIDLTSGPQFDSYELALNSAVQSLGIALGIDPFVNRELEAGTLVEVFEDCRVKTRGEWYLACRKEKTDLEKIALFRQWLLSEIEADSSMNRDPAKAA